MADAEHTPPQDPSFRRSVLRNLAGAVGLVVLVAGIFGVLGLIGREDADDPDLAIDDVPSEEEPADGVDGDVDGSEPVEEPDPTDDAGDDGDADDPDAGDPDPGTEGEPEADEPSPDEPASDPEGEDATDEAEPEPAPDPPAAIDPSGISVQVLDGFRTDGGTAAGAVSEQLEQAGYDIVARNPAIAYEVTTVLWTDGFEAEARQVAAEIDAAEVREQPGNLSTDVNVHVVVGADRG